MPVGKDTLLYSIEWQDDSMNDELERMCMIHLKAAPIQLGARQSGFNSQLPCPKQFWDLPILSSSARDKHLWKLN